MHRSDAETWALKALGFLACEKDALLHFLNLSGLEIEDLRERASEPELLAAVLDFLLADDALLARFASAHCIDVNIVHAARRALPGASAEN